MRSAKIERNTMETRIQLSLTLDGKGESEVDTGCGFLDHMLCLFARHGRFDLYLRCQGDMQVDAHHSVEDVGIVLGRAFAEALGDGRGIRRYGSAFRPMDEALLLCAVDVSGRGCLGYALEIPAQKVGSFDTELVEEFFTAFTRNLGAAVHLRQLAGKNSHHIIEGAFKAFAAAMREAVSMEPGFETEIPSTKGVTL